VGSATLVATTIALVLVVTLGAVKTPVLEIEPLLADHVTDVFELLETVATNCCLPADTRVVALGETATLTAACGTTVTMACADLVVFAALVAVTVTDVAVVTEGALNEPVLEMVPFDAVHKTDVFEVLLTVAVNCCLAAEDNVKVPGAIAIATAGVVLPPEPVPPDELAD